MVVASSSGKKKQGRPRKEIPWDDLEAYAYNLCTPMEISKYFDIPYKTLDTRSKQEHGVSFKKWVDRQKFDRIVSLRNTAFKEAQTGGNPALLKFCLEMFDPVVRAAKREIVVAQIQARNPVIDVTPQEEDGEDQKPAVVYYLPERRETNDEEFEKLKEEGAVCLEVDLKAEE